MTPRFALSVVFPIYNEVGILWHTAAELAALLEGGVGPGQWQFVLVDNGSHDATPRIVRRIARAWPATVALELARPNYGAALRAGLAASSGVWVHVINVDFWNADFLRWGWDQRVNYDLMLASKRADPTINRQTRYRRLLSWGLNAVLALLFDFVGTDTHGPKLLRMAALGPIVEQCVMERGQFDTEFTLRALRGGLRVAEVPIPYGDKRPNRNWMIAKIAWNLRDMVRLRRVIHAVPWHGPLRYHRWSHADIVAEERRQPPAEVVEAGEVVA